MEGRRPFDVAGRRRILVKQTRRHVWVVSDGVVYRAHCYAGYAGFVAIASCRLLPCCLDLLRVSPRPIFGRTRISVQ